MRPEERPDRYYIPDNFNDEHRFRDIPYRNIAEAAVATILLWKLINATPFVLTIRIIAGVVICGSVAFLFVVGIKDESILQFLWSYITFRQKRKIYHLRRVGYVPKKTKGEVTREKKDQLFKNTKERIGRRNNQRNAEQEERENG